MNARAEAARNLRITLTQTLTLSEPATFPTQLNWRLRSHFGSYAEGEDLGPLPAHLQHLCVLALELEEAFSKECHRRCVAFFGKECYDHEVVEFRIHCEVLDDPRFNQAHRVWKMLKRRVRKHWQDTLFTPEGRGIKFYIDQQFHVFKTKYRVKTLEEVREELTAALTRLKQPNTTPA